MQTCFYALWISKKRSTASQSKMMEVLKSTNIDDKHLRIITNLYWNQNTTIRIDGDHTEEIEIQREVRQGCMIANIR